jgi:predicted transcriptional regulator
MGCINEGDFLRHILSLGTTDKKALENTRVGELVRRDFCPALNIDADDQEVISSILNQNFVPIVDGRNTLCGILTRRGVIAYLAEKE